MIEKEKILNRINLLIIYDSSKTLNENIGDKNLINEGPSGKNLEAFLKAVEGIDASALRKAAELLEKDGKPLLRSDETVRGGLAKVRPNEVMSAIANGEIAIKDLRRLEAEMIRNSDVSGISKETKNFLINHLTDDRSFRTKYLNKSREDIINTLTTESKDFKPYPPAQAAEIADTYIAKRAKKMGPNVNPKTTETATTPETAGKTAEAGGKEAGTAGEVAGKEAKTAGEVAGKEAKTAGEVAGKEVESFPGATVKREIKREFDPVTGKLVKESIVDYGPAAETAGVSSERAMGNFEKKAMEDIVENTDPNLKKRFGEKARIFIWKGIGGWKGVYKGVKWAAIIGLGYWIVKKGLQKVGQLADDVILMNEQNQVLNTENEPYDESIFDASPYDTPSTETTTTAPPAETDRRNQVAPPQAPTSSLSLTNIANDVNKPQQSHGDPNAVSPEMRASLINRIKNDKRYTGEDLEPNERAFVDQYIRSMSSRLPSQEKIKYQMSKPIQGKAPGSEPVTQDIKYGYKQK